ncbi:MAG TPA: ABATE domain-containing protein [Lapillicoccus sp.]|nr:ABATE domain-containing protein [Lapillicoccus sp.]
MSFWTDPAVGQWFVSRDGVRWWFDSGDISLDFAYTGSMGGRPEWERWHVPSDLDAWVEERFGVQVRATEQDLATAKELRDAIAWLVTDVSQGLPQRPEQQAVVNRFAAQPDVAPQLGGEPPAPTIDQLLAGLAREAVHMLRDHADRIRECGGDNCAVVYLDTSRSANRRWCSMSRCGNRHKVREQRARQAARRARSAGTDPTGEPA